MIKLRSTSVVGEGQHRSGWPYVMQFVSQLVTPTGIMFDDFADRSFSYDRIRHPYREPWIAVWHHPPKGAPFDTKQKDDSLEAIFNHSKLFADSRPMLKGCVVLSYYLSDYVRDILQVPTVVIRHPTETPAVQFNEGAYLRNQHKRIIQVGWYLRNLQGIFHLDAPASFHKMRMKPFMNWQCELDQACLDYYAKTRKSYGTVLESTRLDNKGYDAALSRNVVFIEFFESSANNAVIECIARNTPLLVNRHPAVREYLGEDYPLFFDRIEDAGKLLTDEKIIEAHRYLVAMDKTELTGERFSRRLIQAVYQMGRTG